MHQHSQREIQGAGQEIEKEKGHKWRDLLTSRRASGSPRRSWRASRPAAPRPSPARRRPPATRTAPPYL